MGTEMRSQAAILRGASWCVFQENVRPYAMCGEPGDARAAPALHTLTTHMYMYMCMRPTAVSIRARRTARTLLHVPGTWRDDVLFTPIRIAVSFYRRLGTGFRISVYCMII